MWSAAILAGGRATRFGGRDKGALLVDGRSIRERQLSELSILTTDILIVGGAASPAGDGARFVEDRLPGLGPLSGLHTALSVAAGDATVVVACDMPYLSAAFLGYLLELTCEAAAVVPQTRTGLHPLCAAYTRACLAPAAGWSPPRRSMDSVTVTACSPTSTRRRITAPLRRCKVTNCNRNTSFAPIPWFGCAIRS